MTLLILGCALPNNWWPLFVIAFYILAPLPSIISRRYNEDMGTSNPCKELSVFFTTAIVISAFGLPIVLARAPALLPVIHWGACGLAIAANIVVFLTIMGFFMAFGSEESDYSMW